jgi:chemotaxis protein histidine kinase CheA
MNDIVARVLADKLDRLTNAIEHLTITISALGQVQDPQRKVLEKIAETNEDLATAMKRVADVQEEAAS